MFGSPRRVLMARGGPSPSPSPSPKFSQSTWDRGMLTRLDSSRHTAPPSTYTLGCGLYCFRGKRVVGEMHASLFRRSCVCVRVLRRKSYVSPGCGWVWVVVAYVLLSLCVYRLFDMIYPPLCSPPLLAAPPPPLSPSQTAFFIPSSLCSLPLLTATPLPPPLLIPNRLFDMIYPPFVFSSAAGCFPYIPNRFFFFFLTTNCALFLPSAAAAATHTPNLNRPFYFPLLAVPFFSFETDAEKKYGVLCIYI